MEINLPSGWAPGYGPPKYMMPHPNPIIEALICRLEHLEVTVEDLKCKLSLLHKQVLEPQVPSSY